MKVFMLWGSNRNLARVAEYLNLVMLSPVMRLTALLLLHDKKKVNSTIGQFIAGIVVSCVCQLVMDYEWQWISVVWVPEILAGLQVSVCVGRNGWKIQISPRTKVPQKLKRDE